MKKTAAALIVILICVFAALTAHASGETFSISDDGKYATLVSYKGNAPEYEIPRTYAGLPVTKIAAGAFSGNSGSGGLSCPELRQGISGRPGWYGAQTGGGLGTVPAPACSKIDVEC